MRANDLNANPVKLNNTCKQYDGSDGVCRTTRSCLRQQPHWNMWNACLWPDGRPVPSKLCCFSEPLFHEMLLNETNSDNYMYNTYTNSNSSSDAVHRADDMPMADDIDGQDMEKDNQCNCGISKVVSQELPFMNTDRKRSPNKLLEYYDMLYPATYRIVMGNNVRVGQLPWICSIYYRGHFICGGSIINKYHVITAAHCFDYSRKPADYHIRVDSIKLFNGTLYKISNIYCHERYFQPRIYHDLAVVQIKHEFNFTDEVSPICLPKKRWLRDNQSMINKIAFVSGFGDTLFDGSQPTLLQEVDLKIMNTSYCNSNYANLIESRDKYPVGMKRSIICAGYEQGGKDACQGDSGGPLTTNFDCVTYIIGVVSFGYKCAQPNFPGVYTNILYYLDWILNILDK